MKLLFSLFLFLTFSAQGQRLSNGTYKFKILWDEFGGKSLGATCLVKIKGDSIIVIHDGNKSMTGNKGEVLAAGIIMKHKKTGKWIIGHSKKDIHSKEIGGCGSGPTIIDFKRKTWTSC